MPKRVTLQDIADALHLSRNTVSKAINNSPGIAEATRTAILSKAAEMGYKQFSYMDTVAFQSAASQNSAQPKEIALLTASMFGNSHFGALMVDKMQKEFREIGYGFTIYLVTNADLKNLTLPSSFDRNRIAGIVCMELFNYEYCQMLCESGIPMLFVDSPVILFQEPLKADILLMENRHYSYILLQEMKQRGVTKIGFFGDIMHCRSFYERYSGFVEAIHITGLPFSEKFSITGFDKDTDRMPHEEYMDYLVSILKNMETLPELFLCANDFVAIDVVVALRRLGKTVPDDIMICGFDDSQESRMFSPELSTVHIHSQSMGVAAVDCLMRRINKISTDFYTVHLETNLILRASTRNG